MPIRGDRLHAPTRYSNLASRYFLMVRRVSGTALCRNVLRSVIMGFSVFSMWMANFSMLRWPSPNTENASLAAGWGSRTPIEEKTSPKSEQQKHSFIVYLMHDPNGRENLSEIWTTEALLYCTFNACRKRV